MLVQQGIIDAATATALLTALAEITAAGPDALPVDPEREDLYFNYEHEVIRRAGAEAGGQMHTGRSRNDLAAALDAMRLRSLLAALVGSALALREALLGLAAAHTETVMTGYTHLQPAQPITLAHYLCGIEVAVGRDVERLLAALHRADRSPLGAAALAGTGHPIDRDLVARLLGFDRVTSNTLDSVASRDGVLEALAASAILGTTLARFAGDLYVWYTREFGTIDLRDRVAGTSSVMPQKKNPIILETVRGKATHALGALVSAVSAVRATPFTNTVDSGRVALEGAWEALEQTRVAAELARLAVENLVVRADLMAERAAGDFSTVTQLADVLAARGLPFRQAHELVGAIVRACVERGLDSRAIDVALVEEAAARLGLRIAIDYSSLQAALDPLESVRARAHAGGPAPATVRTAIEAARADLAARRAELDGFTARLQARSDELRARVRAVLGTASSRTS